MSDLAKKCADAARREAEFSRAIGDSTPKADKRATRHERFAAFIEAAQACRDEAVCDCTGMPSPHEYGERVCACAPCKAATAYDAALRDLAQSMEVSDD